MLKKEDFDKIISGEQDEIILPLMNMSKINDFLINNYNNGDRIEFWSDKNGRDIDYWFYFPLNNGQQLCIFGGVWRDKLKVYIDNDSKSY